MNTKRIVDLLRALADELEAAGSVVVRRPKTGGMMTAEDIAAELQISKRQAYVMIREMRHHAVGRLVRVRRIDFESYVAGLAVASPDRRPRAERTPTMLDSKGRPLIRDTQPRTKPRPPDELPPGWRERLERPDIVPRTKPRAPIVPRTRPRG